jgi:uncharacterized RDD family membrane protein YckC
MVITRRLLMAIALVFLTTLSFTSVAVDAEGGKLDVLALTSVVATEMPKSNVDLFED